jgi:hypothetical protein
MERITYRYGQELGQYGIKYLKELQSTPKPNPKGYPCVERYALFLCGRCGKKFRSGINSVKTGKCKSCGCLKLAADGLCYLPSGERDPIHAVWRCMINRCHNPNSHSFKDYGARGILVCPEWRESFKIFRDWAVSNGYGKGLNIDRRSNDGNYEPNNCRVVLPRVNQSNRRDNRHCWLDGEKMTMAEASRRLGKTQSTLFTWATGKYPHRVPLNLVFEEPK